MRIKIMSHGEPDFEKELQKFSVVKRCPKCGQLALSSKDGALQCSSCGYEQKIPKII